MIGTLEGTTVTTGVGAGTVFELPPLDDLTKLFSDLLRKENELRLLGVDGLALEAGGDM